MSEDITNTMIKTFVGDTCEVTFTGLESLTGQAIYFAVRDRETNTLVFDEIKKIVTNDGEVTFVLKPEMTNKFIVIPSKGFNTYYYGIKQVDETTGEENTILLGENPKFSDKYLIKVYLKKAEGIVENNE